LLIVGSSFPYVEFYPKPDQAKAVQIDLDPQRIGLRYQVDVGLELVGSGQECGTAMSIDAAVAYQPLWRSAT
jgi:thiamine pyrophosphate-dependent acetolactate synthase large subunit-like protein